MGGWVNFPYSILSSCSSFLLGFFFFLFPRSASLRWFHSIHPAALYASFQIAARREKPSPENKRHPYVTLPRTLHSRMSPYPKANYLPRESLSYCTKAKGFLFSDSIFPLITFNVIIVILLHIYYRYILSLGYSSPVGEVGMSRGRKRAVASLVISWG